MANNGWFAKFIHHQNLHNTTARRPEELRVITEAEGYSLKQVFNADKTVMFCKEIAFGFKAAKDSMMLLL